MTVLPDPPHPLFRLHLPPDEIARRTRAIYETVLQRSPNIRMGSFTALSGADLRLLFDLYDATFFGESLAQLLARTKSPRKTNRSRSSRYRAKLKLKNRGRRYNINANK